VIRLGIPADLKPENKKHSRYTIGTLGQLDKRKRIGLLIQQFCKSTIDAELLIAGKGPDRAMLESMAGGDSRVKFLGMVPNEQLQDFYNRLDLFVFPTAIEGYGLPPVEAMACGKPVLIMSDAIIPFDVASHCATVYNLTDVFNNPRLLDSLIKTVDYDANLKFAREHSWGDCVKQYINLYNKIVIEEG
jgi:glycosyltransferase involved in cell wall biosynthesis